MGDTHRPSTSKRHSLGLYTSQRRADRAFGRERRNSGPAASGVSYSVFRQSLYAATCASVNALRSACVASTGFRATAAHPGARGIVNRHMPPSSCSTRTGIFRTCREVGAGPCNSPGTLRARVGPCPRTRGALGTLRTGIRDTRRRGCGGDTGSPIGNPNWPDPGFTGAHSA